MNSSPPKRATVSPGRTRLPAAAATAHEHSSPAAWPRLSLTTLKRSRSRNSTASGIPSRGFWPAPAPAGRGKGPVGQAGERVVERLGYELQLERLALGDVAAC